MKAQLRPRRRAYILAETVAAGLILGAAMILTVRLLGWTAAERRAAERRGWAVQEAANAMEALAALPFDRLTAETATATARLSDLAGAVLPEGQVEARVVEDPPMKRIDVRVRWKGTAGLPEMPVRLTAWVANRGARP